MKAECKDRIQDSRSTHFQFGLDVEPKNTEQVQNARSNMPTVRLGLKVLRHLQTGC